MVKLTDSQHTFNEVWTKISVVVLQSQKFQTTSFQAPRFWVQQRDSPVKQKLGSELWDASPASNRGVLFYLFHMPAFYIQFYVKSTKNVK